MDLLAFQDMFSTEEACEAHLIEQRWPDGYCCEKCGSKEAGYHKGYKRFQCKHCKHQKSITAGTMFHRSHTPLREWFWAIYLMSESKKGISTLELHRLLGALDSRRITHMQTLIRQAMHDRESLYHLTGFVQADGVLFGGMNQGAGRGNRHNKTPVLVALSLTEDGERPEYVKMQVLKDEKASSTAQSAEQMIAKPAVVWTDGGTSFNQLKEKGYRHTGFVIHDPEDCTTHFGWLNTIIGNAKRFILGTHHSVHPKHLQKYLDEFCYRFNRRFFKTGVFFRTMVAAITFVPTYLRP